MSLSPTDECGFTGGSYATSEMILLVLLIQQQKPYLGNTDPHIASQFPQNSYFSFAYNYFYYFSLLEAQITLLQLQVIFLVQVSCSELTQEQEICEFYSVSKFLMTQYNSYIDKCLNTVKSNRELKLLRNVTCFQEHQPLPSLYHDGILSHKTTHAYWHAFKLVNHTL